MNFEKKLVILTGTTGRGTALIEQNGMGVFVTLNTFSLPDLAGGEYVLGVKTDRQIFRREVGSLGRIKSRFSLPEGDYGAAHLVVFRKFDEEAVLYGCVSGRKLWGGNIMDGFRRKGFDKKAVAAQTDIAQAEEFHYSERKIEDYFLSIRPGEGYSDGALAEVNYYDYSPAEQGYYDTPPSPFETQRRYLERRFDRGGRRDGGESVASGLGAVGREQSAIGIEEEIAAATAEAIRVSDIGAEEETEREEVKKPPEPKRIKSAHEYSVEQAVAAVRTEIGFYASVKGQIDKLFESGEKYEPLERAMPGTRWVKIDYDDSGKFYVVGLVGDKPDYIAYGVPGEYGSAPASFEGADFVPINPVGGYGEGFWVLFQSADSGKEIIKNP